LAEVRKIKKSISVKPKGKVPKVPFNFDSSGLNPTEVEQSQEALRWIIEALPSVIRTLPNGELPKKEAVENQLMLALQVGLRPNMEGSLLGLLQTSLDDTNQTKWG